MLLDYRRERALLLYKTARDNKTIFKLTLPLLCQYYRILVYVPIIMLYELDIILSCRRADELFSSTVLCSCNRVCVNTLYYIYIYLHAIALNRSASNICIVYCEFVIIIIYRFIAV